MIRLPDWPERLDEYLTAAEKRPFSWADFNCVLFAAEGVAAMTGVDLSAPYRGPKSMRGWLGFVRRHAGDVEGLVTKMLGPPLPSIKRAMRGDVVLMPAKVIGCDMDALGLCLGKSVAILTTDGLAAAPMKLSGKAWRV